MKRIDVYFEMLFGGFKLLTQLQAKIHKKIRVQFLL